MSNETFCKEDVFLNWLRSNGAKFPKVKWPYLIKDKNSSDLKRCAIALDDIEINENIIEIPLHLIISEEFCLKYEPLKQIYQDNIDILSTDDIRITLFLMVQDHLQEKSFFYPYLNILPKPENLLDWDQNQLKELQDDELIEIVNDRKEHIELTYFKLIKRLEGLYPDQFNSTIYTYSKFYKYWNIIQSRSFGKRLPFTALVPLADCLNHNNVSTKYDYNINNNGMFQFYTTKNNKIYKNNEIFNSYGRNPNIILLLNYGFSLYNNEWDYIDIQINNFYNEINKKYKILKQNKFFMIKYKKHRLYNNKILFPISLLAFVRCAMLKNEEMILCLKGMYHLNDPLSIENEISTFYEIKKILNDYIKSFSTSFEHDTNLLSAIKDGNTNDSIRFLYSLYYRIQRKSIILRHLEIVDDILIYLNTIILNENNKKDLKMSIDNGDNKTSKLNNEWIYKYKKDFLKNVQYQI